jgi:8-oxo-dGTP diphosphatase
MTTPLTVTDPAGGNARHAIGVHIVPVRDDGKILLGLRARSLRLAGGRWSSTCGNLEADESLLHGAVREAHEELGIDIDPGDLSFATLTHFVNDQGFGPAAAVFFTTRTWSGIPEIREPLKCDRIDWFSFDELPAPIVPYVANALHDVRDGLAAGGLKSGFSIFGWPRGVPEATRST